MLDATRWVPFLHQSFWTSARLAQLLPAALNEFSIQRPVRIRGRNVNTDHTTIGRWS
jgi:hypothetical protein